jgi:UDP-N-acetylmuramoyl-tripeptide--D-alanyl-D-alanine ligase
MIAMTLSEIAAIVGGRVVGDGHTTVTGAAFLDTRKPVPGGLFLAAVGEHVDGHDYTEAAIAGGAAAVLAARDTGVPGVLVDDPVAAFGRLARHVVDTVAPTVLAVTGSQGKTGTKDYLAQVLAHAGSTVATLGNLNNEYGVPLTVLRLEPDTTYLALEMGARGIGHIAELCAIAPPHVAAVLNVGTAHLGEFGSREAIASAKGEIVEALPVDGTAVLNVDDALVADMARRTPARVLGFGVTGDGSRQVTWRDVSLDDLGRPTLDLGYDGHWARLRLSQAGAHQVPNAAAAAAMAIAAGLSWPDVVASLEAAGPLSRWRMELTERADGLVVVNDSYNANPDSMKAAIDALTQIGARGDRRTVAVLGVMLELGETSPDHHAEVGRYVAAAGIDVLVAVGPEAADIARGARRVAGWRGEIVAAAGREQAGEWLRHNVGDRDVVLVKASRGAALETLADQLLDPDDPRDETEEGGEPVR